MKDDSTGISIRFIRQYDPKADTWSRPLTLFDQALMLAMGDEREGVSGAQKVADALAFLESRIH